MNLIKRAGGVFFDPRRTFEGLAARPAWIDMLVVVLLALIAFMFIVQPYIQKDLLISYKEHAATLKEELGEDNYNKIVDRAEHPSTSYVIITTLVATPLIYLGAILLIALVLLIIGRLQSTQGGYVQVLSALVHASLIDTLLGNAVRLALAVTRGSVMQTTTSLALLFPHLALNSTSYVLLKQVDFFQLWMFGILAFGLSSVFKIPAKKALAVSYAVWFLKALVNIVIGLIGTSFLR